MKIADIDSTKVEKMKKKASLVISDSRSVRKSSQRRVDNTLRVASNRVPGKQSISCEGSNEAIEEFKGPSESGAFVCDPIESPKSKDNEKQYVDQFSHIGSLVQSQSDMSQSRYTSRTSGLSCFTSSENLENPLGEIREIKGIIKRVPCPPVAPCKEELAEQKYEIRKIRSRESPSTQKKSKSKKTTSKFPNVVKSRVSLDLARKGNDVDGDDDRSCSFSRNYSNIGSNNDSKIMRTQRRKMLQEYEIQKHGMSDDVTSNNKSIEGPVFMVEPYGSMEGRDAVSKYEAQMVRQMSDTRTSGMEISTILQQNDRADFTLHCNAPAAQNITLQLRCKPGGTDIDVETPSDVLKVNISPESSSVKNSNVKVKTNSDSDKRNYKVSGQCKSDKSVVADIPEEQERNEISEDAKETASSKPKGDGSEKLPQKDKACKYEEGRAHGHNNDLKCAYVIYDDDYSSCDVDAEPCHECREWVHHDDMGHNIDLLNVTRMSSGFELHVKDDEIIVENDSFEYLHTGHFISEGITYGIFQPSSSFIQKNTSEDCACDKKDVKTSECNCPNVMVHDDLGAAVPIPLCIGSTAGTDAPNGNFCIRSAMRKLSMRSGPSEQNDSGHKSCREKVYAPLIKSFSMISPTQFDHEANQVLHRKYSDAGFLRKEEYKDDSNVKQVNRDTRPKTPEYAVEKESSSVEVINKQVDFTEIAKGPVIRNTTITQQHNIQDGRVLFFGHHGPHYQYFRTLKHPYYHNSSCHVTPQEFGFDSEESLNRSLNAKSEVIIKPPITLGDSVFFRGNVAKSMINKKDYISNTVFAINWEDNKLRRKRRKGGGFNCCTAA